MNHEGAVRLLGDLMRGNLIGPTENEMLSHVTDCEECRTLSRTYLTLSQAYVGSHAGGDMHPSSRAIVDYAMGARGLESRRRTEIEAHLRTCPSCMLESETVRDADAEMLESTLVEPPAGTLPGRLWASWKVAGAAAAAAVVFGLLAYPAFLGVGSSSRVAPAWSGPIQLPLIQPPLRASAIDPVVVSVAPGQPYVTLAVEPPLATIGAALRFRMAVVAPEGRRVWTQELTSDEMALYAESTGVVTVLLPAAELPAGAYALQVLELTDEQEQLTFETPFIVNELD